MRRISTLFFGSAAALLLCLFSFQTSAQTGNQKLTLVMRVTIDGVDQDFYNGRCGYSGFSWSPTVADNFCAPVVWANNPDSFLCNAAPPAGSLTGKIALIRRATCALSLKAKNAESAGAAMALIANNEANGPGDDCFVTSSVGGGTDGASLTIPTLLLSRTATNVIDAALKAGKSVQICFLRPDVEIAGYYFPVSNVQTAKSQIACDTFGFSVDVTNSSANTHTNVELEAYVEKADGTVLFSTDTTLAAILPGDTLSVVLPGLFTPNLDLGDYVIRYTTYAAQITATPVHADAHTDFHVVDDLMAKEDGVQIGYRPGTIADGWSVATMYRLCANNQEHFKVSTVEFTYATNADEVPITSVQSTLYLFKVTDDILEDWSNFERADFFSPSLEWLGLGTYQAPANMTSYTMQQATIADLSGNPGIEFENGKRYFVVMSYADSSKMVFHGFNEDQVLPGVSTITYSDQWYLGGFQGNPNAVLRIYLELVETGTDEHPLPANALTVAPNPVSDLLNLQVEFANPTVGTITIADLNGRVLFTETKEGLTKETLSYPLPKQMANGTYIARIATPEGTRTVKFVVMN